MSNARDSKGRYAKRSGLLGWFDKKQEQKAAKKAKAHAWANSREGRQALAAIAAQNKRAGGMRPVI